ncbi:hypothetical protein FE784_34360, partial [Paenibacillus hemerocallicola]
MKINYDKRALEVTGITGNGGDYFASNFNNAEGWLKTAWVDAAGGTKAAKAGDALFTIAFKIKDDASLGDKVLTVVKQTDIDDFTFTDTSAVEMDKTLKAGKVKVSNAVVIAVTGVTVTPGTLSLAAGGAPGTLTAAVVPANATNAKVTWTSSNTS